MQKRITHFFNDFIHDRTLVVLSVVLLIVMVLYVVYVSLSISPTELQIATRYTAFGETQYYRNKWFYLLSFIAFAVLTVFVHIAIMIKLHARNMRSIAIAFGYLSLFLMVIMLSITKSVLSIAYLS